MLKDNLRKARKDKHLTQKEVADKLGVAPITISRYETGDREPDLDTLYKIADIYNIKISELLGLHVTQEESENLRELGINAKPYDPLENPRIGLIQGIGYTYDEDEDGNIIIYRNGKAWIIKDVKSLNDEVTLILDFFKYRFNSVIEKERIEIK